ADGPSPGVEHAEARARQRCRVVRHEGPPTLAGVTGGMAQRRLKAGVLGLGVGAVHIVRHLQGVANMELCAGADPDDEARRRFHAACPEARVYCSLEDLAADAEVEVVWVATPSHLHAAHAIHLANAGKHVAVQKPMALTLGEAAAMIEAAHRNGVVLLA